MMRPHCDKCDVVINEGFKKWVEMEGIEGKKHLWHIALGPDDPDLCKACWIDILAHNITELSITPTPLAVDDGIPF